MKGCCQRLSVLLLLSTLAIAITPGIVIDIADPLRAGTRRSGRVSSATTTVVTIDSDTDLSVNMGASPTLSVLLPTGLVETKTISDITGAAVTVSEAFSQAPQAAATYLIQTSDIQSQQFRVVSVAEGGDGTVCNCRCLQRIDIQQR